MPWFVNATTLLCSLIVCCCLAAADDPPEYERPEQGSIFLIENSNQVKVHVSKMTTFGFRLDSKL